MRLQAIAAVAAFFLSLAGTAWAQGRQDFTLYNATGAAIREVYVSPAGKDDWGSDILGKDVLADDEDVKIQFTKQAPGCMWDLLVTYDDDGEKVVWRGFDLCRISVITIQYNRRTGQTSASTE